MKVCNQCSMKLMDSVIICPQCGCRTKTNNNAHQVIYEKQEPSYTLTLAPLWKRFLAGIFDILIIVIPVFMFFKMLPFAGILLGWLYNMALDSSKLQGTLGKKIFKLKVTDTHGLQLTFFKANLRFIAKAICFIPLGLGFIPILFSSTQQGLHDLVAHSCVYNAN